MAGRKRAAPGSARNASASSSSSRQTRSAGRNAIPDVYRDMLSEADVCSVADPPGRPPKRKRPGQKRELAPPPKTSVPPSATDQGRSDDEEEDIEFEDVGLPVATVQTMVRDSDSEDSEEENMQFEDVDFSFPDLNVDDTKEAPKELNLDLSARLNSNPRRTVERRKPINKTEKERRVEIHKTHLLCLLSHVARRNRWCNDIVVQKALRKLLTSKMIAYLNPGTHLSQFGQAESLKTGLHQVETMFKTKYQITERGLRRALWADTEEHLQNYSIPDDAESSMDKADFRDAAKSLKGSRDVGAQLYCALLRSAGIEARLVCSLQPLSFVSGGPSMANPPKSRKKLSVEEQYARRPQYDSSFDSPGVSKSRSARWRLGHPNAAAFQIPIVTTVSPARPASGAPKKIRECPFPVYWVEVLDVGHQKWQPADPLVTQSFWKPRVFEPPASERENCMTYVVAFQADGTPTDVTRRYVKAYNAKTRKMRIESVMTHGDRWWRKALRTYWRGHTTDLDQIESNELNAAEAREPMPRNVVDFKDHPIYALERHFRRNEVLIPGASSAGTVGAGSKGPLERIYRRKDVRLARTREKWYRMGREVRADEIPVKFLPISARKQRDSFGDEGDDADEGMAGTPIFTEEQTVLYHAPAIVNGIIPKNRYGNLDVYVPSMVPEGGAYVADDLAAQAAYTLGIDYAPALTGFQFKGRQGTAVLYGVVVAAEHEEAVKTIISGLKDQEAEMERERRTRLALRAWKKFLTHLRIYQQNRDDYASDDEDRDTDLMDVDKDKEVIVNEEDDNEDRGALESNNGDLDGGFVIDDDYGGGGFL
ncbi:uncharacterized protein BCR38DRAFT_486797 [Pseudomassariella vexata]|uniref:Rad4 transglutaminase-like domain-domain-containing protein n=1 Tax=Pseudomassariella vexata TaxID=1141098 RepID=A0A1Y2DTF1_9PEZI|nr:uncharacterized protein BCR38DRAFT_486797 [Pseudomassariella vexata]ORY62527.1 hypothetical protein BCR38DRAFT_486797 [Pseudomassariella vexata]